MKPGRADAGTGPKPGLRWPGPRAAGSLGPHLAETFRSTACTPPCLLFTTEARGSLTASLCVCAAPPPRPPWLPPPTGL